MIWDTVNGKQEVQHHILDTQKDGKSNIIF